MPWSKRGRYFVCKPHHPPRLFSFLSFEVFRATKCSCQNKQSRSSKATSTSKSPLRLLILLLSSKLRQQFSKIESTWNQVCHWLKLRCDAQFQHAFISWSCVVELIGSKLRKRNSLQQIHGETTNLKTKPW